MQPRQSRVASAVDSLSLPIECQITPPAAIQDRGALAPVPREVHRDSPLVTMSFVDPGYNGDEAQRAALTPAPCAGMS
jgi:hypothetical protein